MSSSQNAQMTARPAQQEADPAAAPSAPLTGLAGLRERLGQNTLVPLLIAAAAVIALLIAVFLWANKPSYRVLFSNLSEADGGRIIAELEQRRVPYRFSEGGQAILVPNDQVHLLRLQLAEQGLPQGGNIGLELMDNQPFGISQFAEQINFQRGLEGELARSIESLGPVERARVHLALARDSVFVRDRQPAKASVVVNLFSGRQLGEGQVDSIVHLVASSVPNLTPDNVTVVNQSGLLLSREKRESGDLDASRLDLVREIEHRYQRRIEDILAPLFGPANFRTQVAAQLDFSRREETAERYGPNQTPDAAAVRSAQRSLSYDGSDDVARGIPGALSNTPPGWEPSLIEQPAAEENTSTAAETAATTETGSVRSNNVINYEVDRNITHIQHQRGQIERLSVAVVLNYRDAFDEEGNPVRVPLSDTELEQVNRLVRQAMGFSEHRGDQLEVVNSPFTDQPAEELAALAWWQTPEIVAMLTAFGRYLLILVLALLLYWMLIKPLLKRHLATLSPATSATADTGATPGIRVTVGDDDDFADDDLDSLQSPLSNRRRKTQAYERNLKEIRRAADEDPQVIAMVVRAWMNSND